MNFLLSFLFAAFDAKSDAELIERLKRREQKAMADLYDRYGKLVYSVILKVVRDATVAEDLTQETFLRVWNRTQFFDEQRGAVAPWLLAVARNRAIDYLRSADGRMAKRSTEFDPAIEHAAAFVDIERDVVNSDRARVLRGAFQKLTPNQKIVIEMAYWEGLSQTEMASRMKQPLGTVKTWVRTALKTLRGELEEVHSS
ncbi:MAG: sigma-70 family RNA polymerase sigma factor [Bryobacteraceae bacterium]|nr:sigma-70 family RNA polymerase sigma factor [Bryobacteraceae bacterium]